MKINLQIKSLYKGLAMGIFAGLSGISAQAQYVDDNVFLQGKYVEVGICPVGAFGSATQQPDGYHGNVPGIGGINLGFVADPDMDGWDVGTPPYIGDYFVPGAPQEGWDIQVAGVRSRAWRNDGGTTFTGDLDGANTGVGIDGAKKYGNWSGNAGNLAIRQRTILDTNKVYFICEVVLKNTGSTPITEIYYNRTVDPDNEAYTPGCSDGYTTTNSIDFQPDPEATSTDGQKCLVSGIGQCFDSYLGLGAVDCRAKAYIVQPFGLTPEEALDDIYDGDAGYLDGKDDVDVDDVGIGIVYKIGTLNPGDSTTLAYAYILRQADLDSAFATLKAGWNYGGESLTSNDTITKCWGGTIDINIQGGGAYTWGDWTPNVGLSNPSGRQNTITVGHDPITYRVIGTTEICPLSDTLYLTIMPEGDSILETRSICQGETYNFLGDELYRSGTYYNVLNTVIGCDSVIQLNLTVNPNPDIEVVARETEICAGEQALLSLGAPSSFANYQWYKDGYAIPGATQHNYAATEPGVYMISGISDKGCDATSRNIQVIVNPAASGAIISISEQDVCIGDTVTLKSDAKANYQYSWSPEAFFRYTGGSLSTEATGIIPGTSEVYLMSMNEYGCKDFDTAVVQAHPCCEIYIPTAFTPNNDGLNDNFLPALRPGQVIVALQIFSRNGQMVYDNNEPLKGWNGQMNNSGELLPQAVYMYRFIYTCTDGEIYETKGDLTILR